MRPIEMVLLAGAGGVVLLQSPAGRAHAAKLIVHGGRAAGPAAVRAGRAAVQVGRATRGRYEDVLTRYAPAQPSGCLALGCDWTQDSPSSAELIAHMRTAHAPKSAPVAPAPPSKPAAPVASPEPEPRRLRAVDDRPAERITQLAPGVYVAHQINAVIDKIGLRMDEFRAVTRALNAAGEVQPATLLALLETLTGVQTILAGVASMVTDIAEHADVEMWVDLRAVGPLYELAGSVMAETQTVRQAMDRLRSMYAEEIEVERKREDGGNVRSLNPTVYAA